MDLEAVKSKWGQCTLLNAALFHAITGDEDHRRQRT
jgi:hypothetical protein